MYIGLDSALTCIYTSDRTERVNEQIYWPQRHKDRRLDRQTVQIIIVIVEIVHEVQI